MKPYYDHSGVVVHHGECLDVLTSLPDASVDSVCTDPPYGLGFMGKAWDDLPPGLPFARECLRVLKPGGHLLAFGGTRTWHRLAVAVEDAGFEIRDSIAWMYGSGFPKSLDVSKAIDKAAGAERVKVRKSGAASAYSANAGNDRPWMQQAREQGYIEVDGDEPATDAARTWQGWGTALKPAFEPIVVARKPLMVDSLEPCKLHDIRSCTICGPVVVPATVAKNVLAHGTGALNIDASRVNPGAAVPGGGNGKANHGGRFGGSGGTEGERPKVEPHTSGRWPANVILDESQSRALDEQSGTSISLGGSRGAGGQNGAYSPLGAQPDVQPGYGDSGGASRFMYTAKADASERVTVNGTAHPTVKPLSLMRWLVRLVTPPGGTVLEPFAGSGTTVEACILEHFNVVAIEREADYLPLIEARITRRRDPARAVELSGEDMGLLGLLGEEPA